MHAPGGAHPDDHASALQNAVAVAHGIHEQPIRRHIHPIGVPVRGQGLQHCGLALGGYALEEGDVVIEKVEDAPCSAR